MKLNKSSLFDENPINNKRQIELDIARGLAVIFMVFVHVQMVFSKSSLSNSVFGGIVDFFGGVPAAPDNAYSAPVGGPGLHLSGHIWRKPCTRLLRRRHI